MNKLIKEILVTENEIVKFVLGDFGVQLKEFINLVDLNHPDLDFILKDYFGDVNEHEKFADNYLGLFKIIKYAKKNNYFGSLFFLKNSFQPLHQDKTFNRFSNIRLLKNQKERDKIRALKSSQKIDLYYLYKEDREFWLDFPDSFDCYKKNNLSYKNEIDSAARKKDRYADLGCSHLSKEMDDLIKKIKDFNVLYYGFHKINAVSSSIILAKILKYNFYNNIIKDSNNSFEYEPCIFPLNEFWDICSKNLKEKIKELEHLPAAGNKPIFDSFFLVIPSFNCVSKEGSLYSYMELNKKRLFNNRKEAFKEMVRFMLKNKLLLASVHGEKNGIPYFIDLMD